MAAPSDRGCHRYRRRMARRRQAREFGGCLRVDRRAVLITSPYPGAHLSTLRSLTAVRLKQHAVPVKIQELPLPAGKAANVDSACHINAHPLQRRTVSDRRDDELAIVLETNEPAIEEMIDRGRQQ